MSTPTVSQASWDARAAWYREELDGAARLLDREKVGELCGDLIAELERTPAVFPEKPARGILSTLRGKRFFQRMEEQPRYSYYEESDFFKDGRAMRQPPTGTIPREAPLGAAINTGRVNGQLVTQFPLDVDRALLEHGQKKFNVVCSQCHGVLGDGNSVVAENMALRLPPSLLELSNKPHGHFFAAITEGYGMMPSFSGELNVKDRWAVVAYVRALQVARGAAPHGPAQNRLPQENR